MQEIVELFPIPVMRMRGALQPQLVESLIAHFSGLASLNNSVSQNLSNTAMLRPGDSPLLVDAAARITPLLVDFGVHLFGERLDWSLKEMWVNVLDTGGFQVMHNHANCFISGIAYLTPMHPEARTMFMRSAGGPDFTFKNDHAAVKIGPYNAERWMIPPPEPGDVVLFPSYLMHAVPPNPGGRRVTMAFNAIPTRLECSGYRISFSG